MEGMTAMFLRFPHLGDTIVRKVGFEDLTHLAECRKIGRIWMEVIDSQRFYQAHIQKVIDDKAAQFYLENHIFNKDERTPIHAAAIAGQTQVFKTRWDAEISFQNEFFHSEATNYSVSMTQGINTPFHFAAQLKHWNICSYIVESVRNLNYPLFCRGDGKLLVFMDSNPKNGSGDTLLHKAALNNGSKLFKKILPNLDVKNPKNSAGLTPLHLAAKHGHLKICEFIVSWIAPENVAVKCKNLWTPLHYAAENGHAEICTLIMGKVQDRNPRLRNGETPRYLARTNLARIERVSPHYLAEIKRRQETVAVFE